MLHIKYRADNRCFFFLPAEVTCFDVEITTTQYGRESSWSFGSCSSSQAYTDNSVYSEQCCLSPGDHTLKCKDSYGDGWHGGFIEIGGERYCEDFTSGKEKTTSAATREPLYFACF